MKDPKPISPAQANVLALMDHDHDVMRAFIIGGQKETHDLKLACLTTLVGTLAGSLTDASWSRTTLRKIFGFTAGWLVMTGEHHVQLVISAERERQENLFASGKFTFTCASKTADAKRKLRVLVEELGEVAEAIEALEHAAQNRTRRECEEHLAEEICQVAAVAVAWLESMER